MAFLFDTPVISMQNDREKKTDTQDTAVEKWACFVLIEFDVCHTSLFKVAKAEIFRALLCPVKYLFYNIILKIFSNKFFNFWMHWINNRIIEEVE